MSEAIMAEKKDSKAYMGGLTEDEFDDIFFADDEPAKPREPVHEDNADPVVPPNLVRNRPGAVRTRGEMVIHTKTAHRLFYGRRKDVKKGLAPIIGLVRFSMHMNKIHEAASKNDPYADAALIKIEHKLNLAEKKVNECIEILDNALGETEGMTINIHESVRPVTVPLEFKTTYGFIASRILNRFDKVVREALSARHAGLITRENWGHLVGRSAEMIRSAFWESTHWKHTGITRNDVAANNAKAHEVIAKYGELPQSILDGSKRGQYAPDIHKASKA